MPLYLQVFEERRAKPNLVFLTVHPHHLDLVYGHFCVSKEFSTPQRALWTTFTTPGQLHGKILQCLYSKK